MVAEIPHSCSSVYSELFAGLATRVFGAAEFWAVGAAIASAMYALNHPVITIRTQLSLHVRTCAIRSKFCIALVLKKSRLEFGTARYIVTEPPKVGDLY